MTSPAVYAVMDVGCPYSRGKKQQLMRQEVHGDVQKGPAVWNCLYKQHGAWLNPDVQPQQEQDCNSKSDCRADAKTSHFAQLLMLQSAPAVCRLVD